MSHSNSGQNNSQAVPNMRGIIISRTKRQKTPCQVSAEKQSLFPLPRGEKSQISTLSKSLFSREPIKSGGEKPSSFGLLFPAAKLSSMFRDNLNKQMLQPKIRDFTGVHQEPEKPH